jgi:hypothetical protein
LDLGTIAGDLDSYTLDDESKPPPSDSRNDCSMAFRVSLDSVSWKAP